MFVRPTYIFYFLFRLPNLFLYSSVFFNKKKIYNIQFECFFFFVEFFYFILKCNDNDNDERTTKGSSNKPIQGLSFNFNLTGIAMLSPLSSCCRFAMYNSSRQSVWEASFFLFFFFLKMRREKCQSNVLYLFYFIFFLFCFSNVKSEANLMYTGNIKGQKKNEKATGKKKKKKERNFYRT